MESECEADHGGPGVQQALAVADLQLCPAVGRNYVGHLQRRDVPRTAAPELPGRAGAC